MIPNPKDPTSTNLIKKPETSEDFAYNLSAKYGITEEATATKLTDMMDTLSVRFEVPVALTADLLDELFELLL